MMLLVGIALAIVGICGFLASVLWMVGVTSEDSDFSSFWGKAWSTFGQEVVGVFLLVSWTIGLYGVFWVVGTPTTWSVLSVFLMLFLPAASVWMIAKVVSMIGMVAAFGNRLIQIGYTIFLLWHAVPVLMAVTFVPSTIVNAYYGNCESPNDLIWRVSRTALEIDRMRFFRSEIDGSTSPLRYLLESVGRIDAWHSLRESWGGDRAITKRDYLRQAIVLAEALMKNDVPKDPASRFEALMVVLRVTDSWWLDDPEWLK